MGNKGNKGKRGTEFWRLSSRNRAGHTRHPLTMVRREQIISRWAAGETIEQIAFAVRVDADTVSKHLRAARKAGDSRAVVRHPATRHAMELAPVDGPPVNLRRVDTVASIKRSGGVSSMVVAVMQDEEDGR